MILNNEATFTSLFPLQIAFDLSVVVEPLDFIKTSTHKLNAYVVTIQMSLHSISSTHRS